STAAVECVLISLTARSKDHFGCAQILLTQTLIFTVRKGNPRAVRQAPEAVASDTDSRFKELEILISRLIEHMAALVDESVGAIWQKSHLKVLLISHTDISAIRHK